MDSFNHRINAEEGSLCYFFPFPFPNLLDRNFNIFTLLYKEWISAFISFPGFMLSFCWFIRITLHDFSTHLLKPIIKKQQWTILSINDEIKDLCGTIPYHKSVTNRIINLSMIHIDSMCESNTTFRHPYYPVLFPPDKSKRSLLLFPNTFLFRHFIRRGHGFLFHVRHFHSINNHYDRSAKASFSLVQNNTNVLKWRYTLLPIPAHSNKVSPILSLAKVFSCVYIATTYRRNIASMWIQCKLYGCIGILQATRWKLSLRCHTLTGFFCLFRINRRL